ncbi:hypothetical protein AB0O07_34085 [Streptomyces sp. NPDC093085]|uniref:hypothetical protein n=1 Tax=Streptomyces sp. NPDC093085 TaxID=3155068 RepID=UPI003418DCFA
MAASQFSVAPPRVHTAPHPMANPGYGKRSAAGQPAPSTDDFALLPGREAAIAGFIDRLPDGADISVKALAKVMEYGQCALRTALNFLERAGHLLRRREFLTGDGGGRWVTRTWFSRTARKGDAWDTGADTETPGSPDSVGSPDADPGAAPAARPTTGTTPAPASTPAGSGPAPAPASAPAPAPVAAPWTQAARPTRSRGYLLLAALGRHCPTLSLPAADCAALEPLATEWFARGAGEQNILHALTHGLPTPVHHPAGLVRSRLTTKLPPDPADMPTTPNPAAGALVECAACQAPGRPEALVDGECRDCRGTYTPVQAPAPLPPHRVRALAAEARNAAASGLDKG